MHVLVAIKIKYFLLALTLSRLLSLDALFRPFPSGCFCVDPPMLHTLSGNRRATFIYLTPRSNRCLATWPTAGRAWRAWALGCVRRRWCPTPTSLTTRSSICSTFSSPTPSTALSASSRPSCYLKPDRVWAHARVSRRLKSLYIDTCLIWTQNIDTPWFRMF